MLCSDTFHQTRHPILSHQETDHINHGTAADHLRGKNLVEDADFCFSFVPGLCFCRIKVGSICLRKIRVHGKEQIIGVFEAEVLWSQI